MTVHAFVDTNVLLYAISTAPEERLKKTKARQILAQRDWGLSIQVLQEFYVNATRPPIPAMSHGDAVGVIDELMRRPTVVIDAGLLRAALAIRVEYQLSYWDAAIVAAAHRLGATHLYSEDLNPGQDYGGVRVINPFGL